MDLNMVELLKFEKHTQIEKAKEYRKAIAYWRDEKDQADRQLNELITEFNIVIATRKYAVSNLAAWQSKHRKCVDKIEKLNRAIQALEDLEN